MGKNKINKNNKYNNKNIKIKQNNYKNKTLKFLRTFNIIFICLQNKIGIFK